MTKWKSMSSAILNQCNFHSVSKHRWKSHLHPFAAYMNKQHRYVKFTSKTEKNNTCFLDINKTRQNNQLKTFVYRKPTFSDVFTHHESYIGQSYKKSLIFKFFISLFFCLLRLHTILFGSWKMKRNFEEQQLSFRYYRTIRTF